MADKKKGDRKKVRLRRWALAFRVGFGLLLFLPAPAPVYAQCNFGVFEVGFPGLGSGVGNADICQFAASSPTGNPWSKLRNTVAYLLITVTIMAGILGVLVGGYLYMISAGDAGKVGTAKKWIFAALLGVTLALLSWVILNTINPPTVQ